MYRKAESSIGAPESLLAPPPLLLCIDGFFTINYLPSSLLPVHLEESYLFIKTQFKHHFS